MSTTAILAGLWLSGAALARDVEAEASPQGSAEHAHGVEAHATDPREHRHEAIEQDERYAKEHPNIVAIRYLSSTVLDAEGPRGRWGVGVVWERELVPRWMELELGANGLAGRDDAAFAVDVLLKKPIPLAPSWELHTGVGGTVQLAWPFRLPAGELPEGEGEGAPEVEGGAIGTFGFFAWPGHKVGLLVEVNGKLLWTRAGIIGEAEVAGGAAFRF